MHDTEALLTSLINELDRLNNNDEIATTLLIHPNALLDFAEYNQFLSITDLLLEEKKIIGVYQIASFHPDYQFAGTSINDAENYTNRSPFPMLHILRESMVEDAIARYQNVDDIPKRNIALMNQIGSSDLLAYFSKIQKKSID